jgi:DHA1 family bicyclomycin/chloramphenicol resistance-like MFS transporter
VTHQVEATTPSGSEPGHQGPPSVGTARLVLVLGFLSGFGAMSIDLYLPAMPQIADTFQSSAALVQVSLTASVFGIGLGQLFVGPLIDVFGRRIPIAVGIAVFTLFSLGCALATSVPMLIAFRFCQALGGAAGQVTARAIARDFRGGRALANLYATLMVVTGVMPLIAPVLGAQLMLLGASWRTIFVVQGLFGVGLAVLLAGSMRLTAAAGRRRSTVDLRRTVRRYGVLLGDRHFMTHVLAGAFSVATIFSFVAASTFVMQDGYGLSPSAYSLCFAASGAGLILSSQVSRVWPVHRRLLGGAVVMLAGCVLQAVGVSADLGPAAVVVGGFVTYCGFGAASHGALALAMADQAAYAGVAAAVYGAASFCFAGVVGPLVGLGGRHSALPMVVSLLVWSSLTLVFAIRGRPATAGNSA